MQQRSAYSFDLTADDLDALRTHLTAAQTHHLDRARHLRCLPTADQLKNAIAEAEAAAVEARGLWSLLVGVRAARMSGESPVGHVQRDELDRFLRGR